MHYLKTCLEWDHVYEHLVQVCNIRVETRIRITRLQLDT
jgi:hypothetical protein